MDLFTPEIAETSFFTRFWTSLWIWHRPTWHWENASNLFICKFILLWGKSDQTMVSNKFYFQRDFATLHIWYHTMQFNGFWKNVQDQWLQSIHLIYIKTIINNFFVCIWKEKINTCNISCSSVICCHFPSCDSVISIP